MAESLHAFARRCRNRPPLLAPKEADWEGDRLMLQHFYFLTKEVSYFPRQFVIPHPIGQLSRRRKVPTFKPVLVATPIGPTGARRASSPRIEANDHDFGIG